MHRVQHQESGAEHASSISSSRHPVFAGLHCRQKIVDDAVFCLMPWVMRWSDHIWLLDITPCQTFWHIQADKKGIGLYELFSEALKGYFHNEYLCIFANHPWQCLVFLDYLLEANVHGVHSLAVHENRQRYETILWKH